MSTSDESTAGPQRPRDTGPSQGRGERTTAAGTDVADDAPAHVGQIGRFIVLRRLGAGGMGVVYLAYDNALDRKLAVKVIRGLSPDPEMTLRMQREARAMAKLSHPNVLQIYEVGESEGSLFLAMEYVDGGPLGAWLSDHAPSAMASGTSAARFDWRAIVGIFVQAGRGLAAAHQAGLVHRDFKPDNVLVGADGVARVADFGLARLLEEAPQESIARRTTELALLATLTGTRGIMGTPAYMSPEQHAGAPTDARTDQFSFCVALWEALHGERPFTGETMEALAQAIARGLPAEPPAGSRVPAWLRAALLRGLAADPERRWPSMPALLAVLTDDPLARRRRRLLTAAAALAGVATIGTLVHFTVEGQTRADVEAKRAAVATQQAEVAGDERDRALELAQREAVRARDSLRMLSLRSIEADPTSAALLLQEIEDPASAVDWRLAAKTTLAAPLSAAVLRGHAHDVTGAAFLGERDEYVATASVDRTARVWRSDGLGDPQVLLRERSLGGVIVGPDRRSFITLGEPSARLWVLGDRPGAPLTLRAEFPGDPGGRIEHAALSADGRRLALADRDGAVSLWEVDPPRLLTRLGNHETRVRNLAFDVTGGRLLSGDFDGGLRRWSTDGGAHDRLAASGALVADFHIDADGRLLITAENGAAIWSPDLKTRRELRGHTGELTDADVSADGREFATASKDGTVRRWDPATGEELARIDHAGPVEIVRYSPDGRWLATSVANAVRLWRRDNRHIVHELHGHAGDIRGAVFSRDSARLLTYSMDNTARVWALDRLTDTLLFRGPKDGVAEAHGGCDVGRVAALGMDGVLRLWDCDDRQPTREIRLSKGPLSELELDPTLARGFYADEDGVWLVALADGEPRKIGVHPRRGWRVALAPDGRHLVTTGYDSTARVWDLAGETPPVVLVGHTSPVVWDAAWSPDGATIATIGNDRTVRIWPIGPVLADKQRGPVELQAAHVFTGHARGAKTVAFDPSGTRVLTSSPDATARIWDPAGVAAPIVLTGHRGMLYDAAWSPDGARVATASEDGTARIWPADGGGPPRVLRGHRGEIGSVAWSPDGRAVVTASTDGTARVWSVEGGVASDVYAAGAPVLSARFTGDGEHILLAVDDGTVRQWRPDRDAATDVAALMGRLRGATTGCITARDRELILLEDDVQSRAHHAACDARHQRTYDVNEGVFRDPGPAAQPSPTPSPAGPSQSNGG